MEHIITDYINHLGIPISRNYFKKCMLSHPDYPSLLSMADTLERLGINHQVGKIEKENLTNIPFPYTLQIDRRGAELLLIKDQEDLNAHKKDLEHWKGVVIKLEPTGTIVDEEHNEQYAREQNSRKLSIILLTAIMGLLAVPLLQGGTGLTALLLAIAIGGAAVGYLLLAKDLGITYKPVESFCNAGKRTNCDRILNAEEATLFGTVTFSDAAASYFGWQLIIAGLFIPLAASGASYVAVLAGAAVFTIPIIGYSLYYQYAKAHTWCRLCVIVDILLSIQIAIFAVMYINGIWAWTAIASIPTAISLFFFAAIVSSIILLKERLKTANASTRAETAAKRVKYNPQVFMHLLLKENKKSIIPFEPEMIIGNIEAPIKMMMIINLYCDPCKKAFKTTLQILKTYPNDICFNIGIFQYSKKNMIKGFPANTYILNYWQQHIYKTKKESLLTQNLLENWYDTINPIEFEKEYPIAKSFEKNSTISILSQKHDQWIKKNNVTRSPTFYVNGYKMPPDYNIQDIQVMIPSLAAIYREEQSHYA